MKKLNIKKQLLIQNVQMDGSVNFQTNGDINVFPCPWESDKVNRGSRGPMYETLFETAHASVKITREKTNRGRVKIDFSFPKKYPLELMKQLFREETLEIAAWLMTRKTNTLWTI